MQDGFENPELGSLLDRLEIGHLQIAGLDGCFCVKKNCAGSRRTRICRLASDRCHTDVAAKSLAADGLVSLPERIEPEATPRRSESLKNATAS